MSSVTMKHIYKKYAGGVIAVTDFNLDIEDKEFIVLVGPSGCGKSTTLRMIAGLEEISEGELYIDGKLCNDVPPKERDIAMVFQSYALYPHMTVYENMAFGLKLRKTPKDEIDRRVEEAAQILEHRSSCWIVSRPLCPAVSVSVLPWAAPSSVTPRSSCWTSLSPTWMQSCAYADAFRADQAPQEAWRPPSFTLPMTRPRL